MCCAFRLCSSGGGPAWYVDLASLPKNYILALGRYNNDLPWTADAWQKGGEDGENPLAFLRVYTPDFGLQFSTAIRGVVPYEMVKLSDRRYLILGQARLPKAPAKEALNVLPLGQADAYYLVVEFAETHPAFAP